MTESQPSIFRYPLRVVTTVTSSVTVPNPSRPDSMCRTTRETQMMGTDPRAPSLSGIWDHVQDDNTLPFSVPRH